MKQINILLVEDNEGDIVLTLETFKDLKLANNHHVVRDGEQALKYLNKEAEYATQPTPDLILLDINLPKMDGKEVLRYIKQSPTLKSIPVVMLTTSSSKKDIDDCYNSHANCYIIKPLDFNKFIEMIKSIENFWISIVQLP
jgi:two-component system, chemotaxis family, response regulator Rcp1